MKKEFIRYFIVGVSTTIVSFIVYYFCVNTFLDPNNALELQIANILSWVFSVLFAFFANKYYVFKKKNKVHIKEFSSFVGSRILTLFLDMGIMYVGVTLLNGNDKFIKIISQVVVIVLNYLLGKLVFKKK